MKQFPARYLSASIPLIACLLVSAANLLAQFTNRYPKVEGYRHHIYLEGYELPLLAAGVIDPAVSPQGDRIALASRGWLWILDLKQSRARRVTRKAGVDSRPAWSPDGRRLAFVRDDGSDTRILQLDLQSGQEAVLVDSGAIDLDPAFSPAGDSLLFSSAQAGDLDIWKLDLASGQSVRLTSERGLELRPLPRPGKGGVLYLSKSRAGQDQLRLLNTEDGSHTLLRREAIASQIRPALGPEGRRVAAGWPAQLHWNLWLLDIENPPVQIQLTRNFPLPLMPTWSPDGSTIYFVEADAQQVFRLKKVPVQGGPVQQVPIASWDWGEPTGRLTIHTRLAGEGRPVAARLQVHDSNGHPLVPDSGQVRFDSQSGRNYFYSAGSVQLEAPLGEVQVVAARGLTAAPVQARLRVDGSSGQQIRLDLAPLWNPQEGGWYSGDHHFHLNYGGPYELVPDDLLPMLRGEDLDVATPQLANLHNRFQDLGWWQWRKLDSPPLIAFAQEVRSHFLGHLGLVGTSTVFWPWYWGPGYPSYDRDDRPNAEALAHARQQGGVGLYVHPVSHPAPFSEQGLSSIPVNLVADAVLGDLDALEVACLWSDEGGTSQVWHRFLNLGIAVAPTAGTDAFPNFYRSMNVGATRVYVRPEGPLNMSSYLDALRSGRSFVTSGPLLDFRVEQARPGDVVAVGSGKADWTLDVYSALPFQELEILVNDRPAWSANGLSQAGQASFEGTLRLPSGGWVAARAQGGETVWPAMDSYPFAHTAPIWIGSRGSTEPQASRQAARDLLKALQRAQARLEQAYADVSIPRLKKRFKEAQQRLESWID